MPWFVVALVVAAAVSAATVGVKAATGAYDEGGAGDAFGDWFKYTLMGWAGGLVGGAATSAAGGSEAAAGSGMTAAEEQAAVAAGESAQLGAGANAAAGVGESVSSDVALSAMEQAEANAIAANEGLGAFAEAPDVGLSAANTTGMNQPGIFDQALDFGKSLLSGDESVTGKLLKMLGVDDASITNYEATQNYGDLAKEFISYPDEARERELELAKERQRQLDSFRAFTLTQDNPFGFQSFNWADTAGQEQQRQSFFNDPGMYELGGGFAGFGQGQAMETGEAFDDSFYQSLQTPLSTSLLDGLLDPKEDYNSLWDDYPMFKI